MHTTLLHPTVFVAPHDQLWFNLVEKALKVNESSIVQFNCNQIPHVLTF